MILTHLSNTIKKLREKISFHKHFKEGRLCHSLRTQPDSHPLVRVRVLPSSPSPGGGGSKTDCEQTIYVTVHELKN